jgi:hypothetical protein
MSKKRRNAPSESVTGRYSPIPHSLLDSAAFQACSPLAKALVFELMRQHTGNNNGHIRLSQSWLLGRGWCIASLYRARDELLHYGLIVQTRHGGLRNGSHLYAMTWLAVTNFVGLDIGANQYHPGAYLLPMKEPFHPRVKKAKSADPLEPEKQNGHLPRRVGKPVSTLPRRLRDTPAKSAAQSRNGTFEAAAYSAAQTQVNKPFPALQFQMAALPGMRTAARLRPLNWRLM